MNYLKIAKKHFNIKKDYNVIAIILNKKGNVLSIGTNKQKTHPLQDKYSDGKRIYLHAEIDALSKCKKHPYKMIVIRLKRNGETALAKPCSVCSKAIEDFDVKIVEYTL
jgi:deoxycytidylate deaminase